MNTSSRFVVATHILAVIAGKQLYYKDCQGVNSEELAESVNTNPVVIRRILGKLAKAHLVVSKTGPKGGTVLARDPAEITLDKIYEAMEEGDLFHMHYGQPSQCCPVGAHIQETLGGILATTRRLVTEALAKTSLLEVVQNTLARAGKLEELIKADKHV